MAAGRARRPRHPSAPAAPAARRRPGLSVAAAAVVVVVVVVVVAAAVVVVVAAAALVAAARSQAAVHRSPAADRSRAVAVVARPVGSAAALRPAGSAAAAAHQVARHSAAVVRPARRRASTETTAAGLQHCTAARLCKRVAASLFGLTRQRPAVTRRQSTSSIAAVASDARTRCIQHAQDQAAEAPSGATFWALRDVVGGFRRPLSCW